MLDMHSILNIVNLLVGEIEVLGLRLNGQAGHFARSLAVCRRFAEATRDPAALARSVEAAHAQADAISEEMAGLVRDFPQWAEIPDIRDGYAAIEAILGVFRTRTQELRLRGQNAMNWQPIPPNEIQRSLLEVFSAIHTQSRGKHHFVFDPSETGSHAYLVVMRLESGGEENFWMPALFNDVIRDLVANARKYTHAGGRIHFELRQTPSQLELAVTDNGRGIPPNEICRIVEFGYRASNTQDRRTYGGGFGLTKALAVAKRADGRMWIASKLCEGTRVRIHLPRPAEARQPSGA